LLTSLVELTLGGLGSELSELVGNCRLSHSNVLFRKRN